MPMRMPLRYSWIFVALLSVLSAQSTLLNAQPLATSDTAFPRLLSDEAEVSVLTVYPGPALHARFGHTAIRIVDPQQGLDLVYNYGVFNFDSPMFVATFASGRLDYLLDVSSMDQSMYQYQHLERRAVVEQKLALTAAEREAVYRFLEVNALPENRTYRYRFLDDNCSTRVRDVFEYVLGDALSFARVDEPATTYRAMLRPYMADMPLLWLGMDLALGEPADEQVGAWDVMFLPLPLRDAFDVATVRREDGKQMLVRETEVLYWFDGADEVRAIWNWPAALFWGLLAAAGVATWREARRPQATVGRRERWTMLGDTAGLALIGVAGVVLSALWFATEHDLAGPNWNLLWAWPTHLLAAVVLLRWPGAIGLRVYLLITAGVALATAVLWPLWPQAMPWAILPVVLLIGLRSAWLSWMLKHRSRERDQQAKPVQAAR